MSYLLAWHEILHRHFRPSLSRKWITAKWLNCMANNYKRWLWKPPSSQLILIYFEFRSKPSLITVICMDPFLPNKLIGTKYCFLILRDDTSFFFFFLSFSLLFYVITNFYKNFLSLLFYLFIYFFSWKLFLFFHVPGCSGMFRVPGIIDSQNKFYRAVACLFETCDPNSGF